LVGVGILSLPLGIKYAGWIIGISGLLLSAAVSKYTAGLLAKCIDVDSSLANFGDIAFVAFGEVGRVTVSSLISLELMVACVGLVILFSDTLGSLIDGPSQVAWKILGGCILAPLQFLPMRWLGFTSFLGIFCNIIIIVVALIVGLLKASNPGSLRDVASTYAFPPQWKALPLSFGLIMGMQFVSIALDDNLPFESLVERPQRVSEHLP
jgi:vesicular inhibitory amino acid transporter